MMINPQVQMHIIDLAWQWAKETLQPRLGPRTQENRLLARAEGFDMAYRAILGTIQSEESRITNAMEPDEQLPGDDNDN